MRYAFCRFVVCSWLLAALASAADDDVPPNILFILSDNQAASLLGAYGNPDIRTPNIDRLASEGMQFNRHYAVNGLCSPTRATLMTGLLPSQHGVHSWLNDHFLEQWPRDWVAIQEFRTLPQTLKNRGYRTAMIGKWHLGQPWEPAIGFETWVTFPLGHTVDFWNNTIINNEATYTVGDQHIVDHFTDVAVEFIENYDDPKPFYLQLNYDGPYMNPPTNAGPARNRHYKRYAGKNLASFPRTAINRSILDQIKGPPYDPKADFLNAMMYAIASMHNDPATMANAASQNTVVDDGVGRVMQALRKRGFDDNTLVIYSSDQGNFYGHHGLWTHPVATSPSSVYDIAMNIPLIVRHPEKIPPGRLSDALIGQYDIMPTILDYVGMRDVSIANSPGRSFANLLRSKRTNDRFADAVFIESEKTRAMRTDRYAYWKRLRGTGEHALYDMDTDPQQAVNVYDDPAYADVVAELDARLVAFFDRYVDPKYDLWNGGTAKGSVDRPEQYRRLYGEQWDTVTTYEPPFEESKAKFNAQRIDGGLPRFYGQVPWASVHRDSRNSDFLPMVTLPQQRVSWSVLDGAALINPGVIDAKGHHYMTTGRGPGYSHLHAFDQDGRLLWETEPQTDIDDFDALAAFNSPVLGVDGDLYVGDGNQFWAFHPDGRVKWVSELPEPGDPFVYQVISRQGYVGGMTTNGWVAFYRRENGELAIPPFKLPAGVAPDTGPNLAGLWEGGLFDSKTAELSKQIAFGYKVQVANAPAVHPDTGRLFITAAGPRVGDEYTGVLYGLDVTDEGIEIAFATRMGGGSGTSPALSPDGQHVYSADGAGQMLAVDTDNGRVIWKAQGEGLLSPAIGADGSIYTGDIFGAPTVIALNPENGEQQWARSYDDYAATRLPRLTPAPPQLPNGHPVARLVSVVSTSANVVWVGMVLGYEYQPSDSSPTLTIPHETVVCSLAPQDGELLDCTAVRDTVEGIIKIGTAGRLFVSHTSIFGSSTYFGLNANLPEPYRAPTRPIGGVSALAPVSYCKQLQLEFEAVGALYDRGLAATESRHQDDALRNTKHAEAQLWGMRDTIALAERHRETVVPDTKSLKQIVDRSLATLTGEHDSVALSTRLSSLRAGHTTVTCEGH